MLRDLDRRCPQNPGPVASSWWQRRVYASGSSISTRQPLTAVYSGPRFALNTAPTASSCVSAPTCVWRSGTRAAMRAVGPFLSAVGVCATHALYTVSSVARFCTSFHQRIPLHRHVARGFQGFFSDRVLLRRATGWPGRHQQIAKRSGHLHAAALRNAHAVKLMPSVGAYHLWH